MAWVRLDDKFWRNPKMRRISHAARGVACDAMSFCADTPEPTGYLTNLEATQRACGPSGRRLIAELVREVVWEPVNGGYLIHDFEKYLEKGSRERCRAWRERKRNEGVTENERHRNVTETSPRATGMETIRTSRFLPDPGPYPEVTGTKVPRRLEMPRRGYRGGDLTALSESLPKVAS